MYVCTKCGNYRSFTVSIPEKVTNSLVKVEKGPITPSTTYEEQSLWERIDGLMQDIEGTMVCDECESMGIVEVLSEHLDTELQYGLYLSLGKGELNKKLIKIMKKEANKVGDPIDPKILETENP